MSDLELWSNPASGPALEPEPSPLTRAGLGPRVICVTGSKGGVGKSLVSANLGIYLATIGRRVVVVDADPTGANVHVHLGVRSLAGSAPDLEPVLMASPKIDVLWTEINGLGHAHAGVDEPLRGAPRKTPMRMVRTFIRELDADFVIVDGGSALAAARLDLWLDADASLFIASPEPGAIENMYRFVRRAFAKHLLRGMLDATERRRMLGWLRSLGHAPAPTDLVRRLDAAGDALADSVRAAMATFSFSFIFNLTRTREDLELGEAVRIAVRRRLGLTAEYLGYIELDEGAWASTRAVTPLLIESPGSKSGKNVEKLARKIMSAVLGRTPPRPPRSVPPESHHDLLEVGRTAGDEEVRRAYKKMKEVFRPDSTACFGLYDEAALRVVNARLDEAYDVLLDRSRRVPYELSVFPPEPVREVTSPGGVLAEDPPPPAPLITPETDFSGALLRAVRESQGITLGDIASRTKVGLHHLESIEGEAFADLPAPVYVRGFVAELAKYLRLDAAQVSRTYLRRYKQYIQEQAAQ